MERIEIPVGDTTLTFKVDFLQDLDMSPPWENSEGHGPVSEWTTRDKKPGEVVLVRDRNMKRFYDGAEATRIAKRDGWGISPEEIKAFELANAVTPTRKMIAQMAVQKDFDHLKAWCDDRWRYWHVQVTLLDPEGNETDVSDCLGGVDDIDNNHFEEAQRMAEELASGMGKTWDVVTTQTYRLIDQGN